MAGVPRTVPATSSPAWPATAAAGTCGISPYGTRTRGSGSSSSTTPPRPDPSTIASRGAASAASAERRVADRVGCIGDAPVQLRAVNSVRERAQGPFGHLHPLQQVALLRLVLFRRDESLVAQARESLERRTEVIGGVARGGRLGAAQAPGPGRGAASASSPWTATRSEPARGGIGSARSISGIWPARW